MPIKPEDFIATMQDELLRLNHYHAIQNKTMEKQILAMYETFSIPVVLKENVYSFDIPGTLTKFMHDGEKENG